MGEGGTKGSAENKRVKRKWIQPSSRKLWQARYALLRIENSGVLSIGMKELRYEMSRCGHLGKS